VKKAKPGDPLRAVGYVRASTDDQKLTPEAQRDAIERYARDRGIAIVSWFEDLGVSGATPLEKRPGIMAAIDALPRERAGALLVLRRDRLARDKGIAWSLDLLASKAGARIVSTDGSDVEGPSGDLLRTMLDAFAEFERAMISSRTRAAHARLRTAGKPGGREAPYGFRRGASGLLEPDPREKEIIQYVRAMRERGKSYAKIVELCTKRGYFNRKGKPFVVNSIVTMLRRGDVVRGSFIMSTPGIAREKTPDPRSEVVKPTAA
jgi:site-specific DNA recombinase